MINGRKKSFSLVELIIVIAIIGILLAIGSAVFKSGTTKSRDVKRVADMKSLMTALNNYYDARGFYPIGTNLLLGGPGTAGSTTCSATVICQKLCNGTSTHGFRYGVCTGGTVVNYMAIIPKDPSNKTVNCTVSSTSPCRYAYTARPTSCNNTTSMCTGYNIYGYLEEKTGALDKGVFCVSANGMSGVCP